MEGGLRRPETRLQFTRGCAGDRSQKSGDSGSGVGDEVFAGNKVHAKGGRVGELLKTASNRHFNDFSGN